MLELIKKFSSTGFVDIFTDVEEIRGEKLNYFRVKLISEDNMFILVESKFFVKHIIPKNHIIKILSSKGWFIIFYLCHKL